jgi:hypothetical protein
MQFVPRASIRSIRLRYGCAAHRPVLELITGIALATVGVIDLYGMAVSFKASRYDLGLIAFGMVGGYLIYSVLRKNHYLQISTASNHFNIRFKRDTARSEIEAFCSQIEKTWQYQITKDV